MLHATYCRNRVDSITQQLEKRRFTLLARASCRHSPLMVQIHHISGLLRRHVRPSLFLSRHLRRRRPNHLINLHPTILKDGQGSALRGEALIQLILARPDHSAPHPHQFPLVGLLHPASDRKVPGLLSLQCLIFLILCFPSGGRGI